MAVVLDVHGHPREAHWSAQRNARVVFRVLREEPVDDLAHDTGVTVPRLLCWSQHFVAAGTEGLKGAPGATRCIAADPIGIERGGQ